MNARPIIASLLLALVAGIAVPAHGAQVQHDSCKGLVQGTVFKPDGERFSSVSLVLEPVGDYDTVLPHTKANQAGEYRFDHICEGEYRAAVEDKSAGYPHSTSLMNFFLYGAQGPRVNISSTNLNGCLDVHAPPKPGILRVHLVIRGSAPKIDSVNVHLRVSSKRTMDVTCDVSESFVCGSDDLIVPPDQDVKLRLTSSGFHAWPENAGGAVIIRVPSGSELTIVADLNPSQH